MQCNGIHHSIRTTKETEIEPSARVGTMQFNAMQCDAMRGNHNFVTNQSVHPTKNKETKQNSKEPTNDSKTKERKKYSKQQ